MSYYCELKMKVNKGTPEDINAILGYLNGLANENSNDHEAFKIEDMTIYTDNGMTRASKIWGKETLNPEPDLYVEIAKLAPATEWTVESFRVNETGGYGQTYLEAEYANGLLRYRLMSYVDRFSFSFFVEDTYDMYCDETPDEEQMDLDEFIETFDYEQFCNFYNPDGTITERNFEKLKEEDASIYFTEDNDASLNGWWEEQEIAVL